ncbi:two-component system, OmpR family, response regulator VanR [Plantibacter flavus]|uniref:Two-component system response regulator VanR n=1 Tax=Plantibacter flavus TaxID=150123 RepID=A0A3N2BXR2_9MICO|nr:response regulator transcription factor [Plantibacter flavus]ROR80027.1 two-component system response regulator VanR [Plantibacter flavus]SMG28717.1 two-component system, OmpR family, response regulator VanR [Plantibacter flavus]
MRVLIVEDEVYLAKAIRSGLGHEAIAADITHDGASALEAISVSAYDALILDRDLPVVHGDEVCRRVVADYPAVRVLMLTAARGLDHTVSGLRLGADDYLVKPFEFPELVARLRALARRTVDARPPVLERAGIRLDPFRREVTRDGVDVRLSRKEFAVLEQLLLADGGVVSAEMLLEKAWDERADPFTNTIRVTVSNLRRRLGVPWVIQTVPGSGYKIDEVLA